MVPQPVNIFFRLIKPTTEIVDPDLYNSLGSGSALWLRIRFFCDLRSRVESIPPNKFKLKRMCAEIKTYLDPRIRILYT
jgi:hypothetical protein